MFNINKSGFFGDMKDTVKNNKIDKFHEENQDPDTFRKAIIHNIKLARVESGILASLNLKKAIAKASGSTVSKQAKLNALTSSRDSSTNSFSYAKNSILMSIEKKKLSMLSKLYKTDNLNSNKAVVAKKNATDTINQQKESNDDDNNTEDFRNVLLKGIDLNNDLTEKTNKILLRIEKNSLLGSGGKGLLGGLVDGVDLDLDRDKKGGRGKGGRAKLNRVPGFDIPESSKEKSKVSVNKEKFNDAPDNKSKSIDIDKPNSKVDISKSPKVDIDSIKGNSKLGKLGSLLKKGVKFIPGIGMVAAIGTAGYAAAQGYNNASEITGIDEESLTELDKTMAGLSSVIEDLSFGLLDSKGVNNFFVNSGNVAKNTVKDVSKWVDDVTPKTDEYWKEQAKERDKKEQAAKPKFEVSGNFKNDVKNQSRYLETSKYEGNYSKTGDIGDDAGLSFGAYQLTEKSGGIKEYLKRMSASDPEAEKIHKNYDSTSKKDLAEYLKKSGNTEKGRETQDKIYDDRYYNPSMKLAAKYGITDEAAIAQIIDHGLNSNADQMLGHRKGNSAEDIAAARREHYMAIIRSNPAKYARYQSNWFNRVDKFDKNLKDYKGKDISQVDNLSNTTGKTDNNNTSSITPTANNISAGNDNVDAHLDVVKQVPGSVTDPSKPLDKATVLPDMSNNSNNSSTTSPVLNNQNNSSSNSSVINNNAIQPDNSFGLANPNLTQYLKA